MADLKTLKHGRDLGWKIFEKTGDPIDYVKYVGGFNELIAEKTMDKEQNQPGL